MTGRSIAFLIAGGLFYLFANQTQVGWLYVVAALLLGIVLAGWLLNRRALHNVSVARALLHPADAPLHEGDDLRISLTLYSERTLPAAHLDVLEQCPLAAPDHEARALSMFVPLLNEALSFDYSLTVYQRGVYRFPAVTLRSRAPFGFFRRVARHNVETALLVYPEVRSLAHFSLLDRQPAAQLTHPRAGLGSEVIGVRPYRTGDSPRHIHWRSVARHGQLISKEFAEETQPGVTLVLDRYSPLDFVPEHKHTPFEMAVKCAVSMGEYALRRGYPLHLAADNEGMAVPQGALVWDALLQYTARVQARDESRLADVLQHQPMQQFVAVALSWPAPEVLEALFAVQHRGYRLFVALPDPATYPIGSDVSAQSFADRLQQAGIETRLIPHGVDWALVLSEAVQESD